MLHPFPGRFDRLAIPLTFFDPFSSTPHPLAVQAAARLRRRLSLQPTEGKMFGVLVVETQHRTLAALHAFSGMLHGSWIVHGFVPPIFDPQAFDAILGRSAHALTAIGHELEGWRAKLNDRSKILQQLLIHQQQQCRSVQDHLLARKAQRDQNRSCRAISQLDLMAESQRDRASWRKLKRTQAHERLALEQAVIEAESHVRRLRTQQIRRSRADLLALQQLYIIADASGRQTPLLELFAPSQPPGGTGDCVAPKLLHYAHRHRYRPVALAEFWWGPPPKRSDRTHGHYYPPCDNKCRPLLNYMLNDLELIEHS